MKRFILVDFLKGFSILTIVIFHLLSDYPFPTILQKAFQFGGAGVHVFILCSGFGLYLSYLKKQLTYSQFLQRRFTRIYWPYFITVSLTALWILYTTGNFDLTTFSSHIFLFKMFVESYENSYGEQMWFVSTIIQFYIFWPLILKLYNKNILYLFIISFLWPCLIAYLKLENFRIYNSFFLQYLWEFVLGMYFAKRVYAESIIRLPKNWILILCSLLGVTITGLTGMLGGFWKLFNDCFSLIGYLSIVLIIYNFNIKLISRFLVFISKFSYELYLSHILTFGICKYFIRGNFNMYLEISLCFIISIYIAYLYNLLWRHIATR